MFNVNDGGCQNIEFCPEMTLLGKKANRNLYCIERKRFDFELKYFWIF